MKITEASACNSWLTFADDLLWSREATPSEAKILRNMLCQQVLFVETALIPDSWWLTNPQLRKQFDGTDLLGAVNHGWIATAIENQFVDSGLHGRWLKQKTLPPGRRYSRLLGENDHGAFLGRIDKQASFVTYDGRILGVQFSDGREGYYNRIVESEGKCGVAIIPINTMMVGLVRQFRYPVGKELWEIPRGFGEHSDPREDAVRELREETAIEITPEMLVDLGLIHPNSGILAAEVQLFAARCENAPRQESARDNETADFRWFPVEKVLSLIDTGAITDSFTLCALLRARLRRII